VCVTLCFSLSHTHTHTLSLSLSFSFYLSFSLSLFLFLFLSLPHTLSLSLHKVSIFPVFRYERRKATQRVRWCVVPFAPAGWSFVANVLSYESTGKDQGEFRFLWRVLRVAWSATTTVLRCVCICVCMYVCVCVCVCLLRVLRVPWSATTTVFDVCVCM